MSRFYNPELERLSTYTPGEQPKNVHEFIKLNTNESPFPPSPKAVARMEEEIKKLNLYPDPNAACAVDAVADFYGVKKENVCIFNGSDEALSFCFQLFCSKGAKFADITYGFYPVYANVFGVKTKIIPLKEDLSICVEKYNEGAETVFIANPNATTGIALSVEDIRKVLDYDRDRLVVVDEAYVDFGTQSCVSLIGEYDNLLVVQTMSKSRSFAGARLGLCIGNAELISDLNRLRYCFNPYNVNRLSLVGAAESFKDKEYFRACTEQIIQNREFAKVELKKLGFEITDSSSNFILAKNDKISGQVLYETLKSRRILVRHFKDKRVENYVRITIGSLSEMQTLIKEIKEILEEIKNA